MRKKRSDSKTPLIIERTREYLRSHRTDPASWPLDVRAIAKWVPCAHRLFYKPDPLLVELLDEIEQTGRHTATASGREDGRLWGGGSVDDVEEQVRQALTRALWSAKRFVSQRERSADVADAPLALFDLDTLVRSLGGIADELRPAVARLQALQAPQGTTEAGTATGSAVPDHHGPGHSAEPPLLLDF